MQYFISVSQSIAELIKCNFTALDFNIVAILIQRKVVDLPKFPFVELQFIEINRDHSNERT